MSNLIGIFGGTFDPPHLGHLILAAEACQQLGLRRLLWVLTP
ncbi:MAG: nicotinic acid mononucleotide adenylyltransferase, partial [Anaerolineae bacterium CG17_big_fil_post_rev_8_21_14_2_50_57_27]